MMLSEFALTSTEGGGQNPTSDIYTPGQDILRLQLAPLCDGIGGG